MTSAGEPVMADGGGLRYNEGKPPLELVPPEVMWALAAVLAHGEKKYARRNWERGMSWATVYACLLRHLLKWFQGEEKDAESGLSHLDHVLWNAMALVVYERRRIGEDDRPRLVKGGDVERLKATVKAVEELQREREKARAEVIEAEMLRAEKQRRQKEIEAQALIDGGGF